MGINPSKLAISRAEGFCSAGKSLPDFMSGDDIYYHNVDIINSFPESYYRPHSTANDLPELPIEIWQRVFVHLRRKVGPIKGKQRERGDWHQRDLVNAMLACKKFYYLTAPILYARVITDRPDLLFYAIGKKSLGGLPERYTRWTKLDLLQFVHRLDLAYGAFPITKVDLRFPISEEDKARFEEKIFVYSNNNEEIRKMVNDVDNSQSAVRQVHDIRTLRKHYLKNREPVIMSNLEILTVHHPSFKYRHIDYSTDIPYYGISHPNDNVSWPRYALFPNKLERYRQKIDGRGNSFSPITSVTKRHQFSYELARIATPRHVCMDDDKGPYAYRRDEGRYDKIKLTPPESITLHVYPRSVGKFILPPEKDKQMLRWRVQPLIFYGSTYRWVLDDFEWTNHSDRRQKADLYQWLKWNISEFRTYFQPIPKDEIEKHHHNLANAHSNRDEKTKVEIYGCLDVDLIDEGFTVLCEEGYTDYDINWTTEQKRDQVLAFLEIENGVGEVQVMEYEAGVCPACGVDANRWTCFEAE
ncbi:hypothetical protein I302_105358 [Kwoniella bestiolae CBS 10118]|uniref:F-box domain-containing protein n=1 Tax=Kwoniella bestiolae CBS 10118 TaxID=1296100 RepID=A0A1B9FSX5_9TREE|nr:hypothetical protein I302_08642 [Kwoniella bestiolae CBS 10118]OCF21863.1 hypothetical protein I302_08642 [Kwoniella bestiolae CBS 10118]